MKERKLNIRKICVLPALHERKTNKTEVEKTAKYDDRDREVNLILSVLVIIIIFLIVVCKMPNILNFKLY